MARGPFTYASYNGWLTLHNNSIAAPTQDISYPYYTTLLRTGILHYSVSSLTVMPKQRQTCTRCSQRRQKCDRKAPCTRCLRNGEGYLCTTKWVDGYNAAVHRAYPRNRSSATSRQSTANFSDTSSSDLQPTRRVMPTDQHSPIHAETPSIDQNQSQEAPVRASQLPENIIDTLLDEKDQQAYQGLLDQSLSYIKSKGTLRDVNGVGTLASSYSLAAKAVEIQHLQSILPSKDKIMLILEYYEQYMLYWISGLYHGPSFRKKLLEAYGTASELDL